MALTKVSRGLLSTGIVDNSDATAITIDSSENVGIGTGTPGASTKLNVAGRALFTAGAPDPGDSTSAGVTIGYDTSNNFGFIQAVQTGVANKPLRIQPLGTDLIIMGAAGASVAIGTTTASTKLTVAGDITATSTGPSIFLTDTDSNPDYQIKNGNGTFRIIDTTNSTDRLNIASDGNVLVGQTANSSSSAGTILTGSGVAFHTRDGGVSLVCSRLTDDGSIAQFRKGSTVIGEIGTTNSLLTIGSGDAGFIFNSTSDAIYPWNISTNAGNDNSIDLGIANRRIKNIYVSSGIYLGGTGSSNHLDDYEEGTWTPAIGSGTASFGGAWYVKIGRLVTVHCNVYSPSDASSGNNVFLSGLPFASGGGNQSGSAGGMIAAYVSGGPYYPYVGASTSTVYFYDQNTGAYHTMKHSDLASNTDFHFTISYYTDS